MKITREEILILTSRVLDNRASVTSAAGSPRRKKNLRVINRETTIANLALSKLNIAVRINGRGYFELPDHADFDLLADNNAR